MHERNLDHEILKLMEAQPDIKEREIASKLSVPEELVQIRIADLKDTRKKILIMTSGNSFQDSIEGALEAENYSVIKAPGSFSALEAVKTEKPDLVLL